MSTTRTGTLRYTGTQSQLSDGTLLARCGDGVSNPLSAGTAFLKNLGFHNGDVITVTGAIGHIGDVAIFCMTAAVAAVGVTRTAKVRAKKSRN